MTLQERLRTVYRWADMALDELLNEAADALDAKDARIKELEEALQWALNAMESHTAITIPLHNTNAAIKRAREALK